MEICVQLSSVFKILINTDCVRVRIKGNETGLMELLYSISDIYEGKVDKIFFDDKRQLINHGLLVQINGKLFTGIQLNKGKVNVKQGDQINILYFISGG